MDSKFVPLLGAPVVTINVKPPEQDSADHVQTVAQSTFQKAAALMPTLKKALRVTEVIVGIGFGALGVALLGAGSKTNEKGAGVGFVLLGAATVKSALNHLRNANQ